MTNNQRVTCFLNFTVFTVNFFICYNCLFDLSLSRSFDLARSCSPDGSASFDSDNDVITPVPEFCGSSLDVAQRENDTSSEILHIEDETAKEEEGVNEKGFGALVKKIQLRTKVYAIFR